MTLEKAVLPSENGEEKAFGDQPTGNAATTN